MDEAGIGGGAPSFTGTVLGRSGGCIGLPKPIDNADFLGGGGCSLLAGGSVGVSSGTGTGSSCLTPVLEGRAGVGLALGWGLVGTLGVLPFLNMLDSGFEPDFAGLMTLYFCS